MWMLKSSLGRNREHPREVSQALASFGGRGEAWQRRCVHGREPRRASLSCCSVDVILL